jgi:hypothetical protein
MLSTIPQDQELIKNLFDLLAAHRGTFNQERVYQRAVALVIAEVMAFGRHTVTQLLLTLGLAAEDWSAWYRLFSKGRFVEEAAGEVLVGESLKHVGEEELYVVAGDGTQVPRSSYKMEGSSWLHNPRSPAFKRGIHRAQRWFNGSWLTPAEKGYSRALPLRFLPAFTAKARRQITTACKEWEAALVFLNWLLGVLARWGRAAQRVLMVADGSFDTVALWLGLPEGVILLVRSARNRVLHGLVPAGAHANRKYGERAPTPQAFWQQRTGWKKTRLLIRGRQRDLQYRVEGPFLRKGAPQRPLFLLIVRGQTYTKHGRPKHREPLPYLVNAGQNAAGQWILPLPADTLLFWAWQRWEVEVAHREMKTSFGLGDKQCWNPLAALRSVQWSAWVYSLLLLAGYRTWGLCGGPAVPSRWWRGAGRWSLATLWRAYRAALWGHHVFHPLFFPSPGNWLEKETLLTSFLNPLFAAARP